MKKLGLAILFILLGPIFVIAYFLHLVFDGLASFFELVAGAIASLLVGQS